MSVNGGRFQCDANEVVKRLAAQHNIGRKCKIELTVSTPTETITCITADCFSQHSIQLRYLKWITLSGTNRQVLRDVIVKIANKASIHTNADYATY